MHETKSHILVDTAVSLLQVGFMSFYALPLFAEMAKTFSELVPIQAALRSNYDTWNTMAKTSN